MGMGTAGTRRWHWGHSKASGPFQLTPRAHRTAPSPTPRGTSDTAAVSPSCHRCQLHPEGDFLGGRQRRMLRCHGNVQVHPGQSRSSERCGGGLSCNGVCTEPPPRGGQDVLPPLLASHGARREAADASQGRSVNSALQRHRWRWTQRGHGGHVPKAGSSNGTPGLCCVTQAARRATPPPAPSHPKGLTHTVRPGHLPVLGKLRSFELLCWRNCL